MADNGIRRVISVSKDRVYAVADVGRMAILDLKSGARIAEIPTEEFDLRIANQSTDRIYLGTTTGMLQCLRETGHYWPHVHGMATESAKPKRKVIQKGLEDGGDPLGRAQEGECQPTAMIPLEPEKPKAEKPADE